ncbi:kinase-like protein [Dendrothele bispora CBS 962.96]|uniref:Kinase-like protein n=1 Tax=Dendrothele bispora (strain CBS 962.96) TaxID=1314807 RepID=A0A4S8MM25_DENBC|nr:kinase-like protein [Dendrothele bispora CBS 962.96]
MGKSLAQITAEFAPIPGLCLGAELLCGIIELCENITTNKHEVRQLRDRCHHLLLTAKESEERNVSGGIKNALQSINDCLTDVKTKMHGWTMLSKTQAFLRQAEIKLDIERSHAAISDCLTKFQIISQVEINQWQEEFAMNVKLDHQEIIEYLSEIANQQEILRLTMDGTHDSVKQVKQMMEMFQSTMNENKHVADRTHVGLSSNLYQLQFQSNEILPDLHLNSGEVQRIGQFPVSGTAAMDIYEGLYLGREKVAIKVVRAVNSNESSLRRFRREVKVWAEIWRLDRGKHVLPFYGFCQNDGPFPYMVSPWQPNGNALSYVKTYDHKVNYRQMIKGIALGLKVLHDMEPPVVHGDIKAANIVIDNFGHPLLADFGLSQIVEDITGIPFTQSRGVSDSYRWFAPEVCVGEGRLSIMSDIYAYAMTVLEVLTHQQPYRNIKHTTEVVIKSSLGQSPARPMEPEVVRRGLDDSLWALLNKCWSLEASKRPTIYQIIELLPS